METAQAKRERRAIPSPFLRAAIRRLAPAALAILLLTSIAFGAWQQWAGLARLREVGYGDAYVLYDVLNFEKTGIIYRNLSEPPYLPAQYSPLVYITYSLSRFFPFANIFLAPRLIALATFLLCLGMAVTIVKKLIPVHFAWLWGALLVASTRYLHEWVLQLRGDFLGILFGLAAIRLLMSRSRYRYVTFAAGLCAGMAIQIKLTLIGAAAAGLLWLLMRRRWADAGWFALGTALTSVGLFLLYWLREPSMIPQMLALLPGIKDPLGSVRFLVRALREPMVLLAIAGAVPFIPSRFWPPSRQWSNWTLLLIYALATVGLGFLADINAGGFINYFYEFLFALTPFAVLGALRLFAWSSPRPWAAFFVAGVFLIFVLGPTVRPMAELWPGLQPGAVRENNRSFTSLENALRGLRILSVDPRVAMIDPHPPLMEAYLLSYSRRLGRFDAAPLIARISAVEFDVFVSAVPVKVWRGVRSFDGADLEKAVSDAYEPYCSISGDLVELPRSRHDNTALRLKLREAGCVELKSGEVAQNHQL
jgi:hypothetical protein